MNDEELLSRHFGFDAFRPGQQEVLAALDDCGAALAVFPTGAGKSLCYQLPALRFEGVTLVVSPLIALMKDQIDFLTSRGIAAARLDSTMSMGQSDEVAAATEAGRLKILYVAPERFNNERFLGLLGRSRIALLAVDEAHCISQWGHNFRPDYLKLAQIRTQIRAERVLALTATATPEVVADICRAFEIPARGVVVTGFYRPNLTLLTTPVPAAERDDLLVARLRERPPGPGIVYVTLQKTAERVAGELAAAGFAARAYHAGLETEERSAVQEWWMAAPAATVVATIAFGMGIDKAGVRYVYHYNLPKGLESYAQEIGRAGRDGLPATVELLACRDDVPVLENFAYGDTPTTESLRALVDEVLGAGDDFHVSQLELSSRHDIRVLVLRTALTYLELDGVLAQGTPFYATYELKPSLAPEVVAAQFEGERGRFIADLFAQAKKGRTWYTLDPGAAAEALKQPRDRVVRAIDYLQEKGLCEVRASDVRQRYRRLRADEDAEALVAGLVARFATRESHEIARLARLPALVTLAGCQVNALVGYFGEVRPEPCGHCTFCLSGAQSLPETAWRPPLPAGLDVGGLEALAREHPAALGLPRQRARFLCGMSSPRLTRARLGRHPLFGVLEDRPFKEVLAWCG